MVKKEVYLTKRSEARALLKNYGHMEDGSVVINPEYKSAKLLMESGYSKEEAWMEVARDLEKNKKLNKQIGVMRNPNRIIVRAYENSGTEEGRKKARQLRGILSDSKDYNEGILDVIYHGLEGRVMIIFSIGVLGASLFFLSSKITGDAVMNLSQTSSSMIGVLLFALGILGLMLSFKKK